MRRHLSGPALALLSKSSLAPEDIDEALEELVRNKAGAVLRARHPLVHRIRQATDINLVQIARRSRYLLIEIEQRANDQPLWLYREQTPRHCLFSCSGKLPETIGTALNGELLEKLVIPAAELKDTQIANVDQLEDAWLSIDVTPTWQEF